MKSFNEMKVIEITQSEKVEITGGGWGPIVKFVVKQVVWQAAKYAVKEGIKDANRY